VTIEARKALATIEDALPTLVRSLAEAAQSEAELGRVQRKACDTAEQLRNAEKRAEAAEHRARRLAKAWTGAENDVTTTARATLDADARATKAEQRLDTHRRRLAAILAQPAETPLEQLGEYAARTLTGNGARLLAADKALAAMEADRNRQQKHATKAAQRLDQAKRDAAAVEQVADRARKAEQRADQTEAELAQLRAALADLVHQEH
jgi:chromosome segregation ATPase